MTYWKSVISPVAIRQQEKLLLLIGHAKKPTVVLCESLKLRHSLNPDGIMKAILTHQPMGMHVWNVS